MSGVDLQKLLADADKRNGFPAGTMASVWKQETGGSQKYIDDPTAYHYAAGADGRRVAGHTGKVSTAFGPFGILESTAADPGYGVKPLASKDLAEQVRFASDYLAARSKQAGGLDKGLAGYGEGTKYASQVQARRDGGVASRGTGPATPAAPVVAAAEQAPGITQLAAESPSSGSSAPVQLAEAAPAAPAMPSQEDQMAWVNFQNQMAQAAQRPAVAAQPDMAQQLASIGGAVPAFQVQAPQVAPRAIDFRAFGNWGGARA